MTDRERAVLAAEIASAVEGAAAPVDCNCSPPQGDHRPSSARSGLNGRLDLSFQRPDASLSELEQFLAIARTGGFRSVCVPPRWMALAVRALDGCPTRVGSVVGYPNGTSLTPAKCAEAECLLRIGASELWMVADTGGLRSGDLDAVFVDIRAVSELAQCRNIPLNVILELPLLAGDQKVEACVVAKLGGAAAAVSATGFHGAADATDISLMRRTIGGEVEIVAGCGVTSAAEAERMLDAGADRVYASSELEVIGALAGHH